MKLKTEKKQYHSHFLALIQQWDFATSAPAKSFFDVFFIYWGSEKLRYYLKQKVAPKKNVNFSKVNLIFVKKNLLHIFFGCLKRSNFEFEFFQKAFAGKLFGSVVQKNVKFSTFEVTIISLSKIHN